MLAVLGTLLTACGDNGPDPILGTDGNVALPPVVIEVAPADEATNVPTVDTLITAQFNEPVQPLTNSDFTVTCNSPCISPIGTVDMSDAGTMATFTVTDPLMLDGSTLYTATVHSAESVATGLLLEAPFTWIFTTGQPVDDEPPMVVITQPMTSSPGPTLNVPVNSTVFAVFNESMLASTISETSFTVSCEAPCVAPDGALTYDADTKTALFTPTDDLEANTTYTVTVASTVTDLAGNELAGNQAVTTPSDYMWQFTTSLMPDTTRPRVTITEPLTTSPGPTNDVPVNTAITAIFTENMVPVGFTAVNFTLTCETPCVSPTGEVSYVIGSRSAVFTPEENLIEGTTYTATISSAVTDIAGNELAGNQAPVTDASDYVWTFTTVEAIPVVNLSVETTDPLNAGTLSVCPNASINATVDIPSGTRLNPTTVNDLTFTIVEDENPANAVIAESITLDVDTGTIITFIPQTQLAEGVTFRATVSGGANGVKDLIVPGNEMLEDYVWLFTTVPAVESCLEPVDLQTVAPFGSFGGTSGATNQGLLTVINGDLGSTAVSTLITGFVSEPGCEYTITPLNEGQVNGKIFTSPPPPTVACPQDGTAVTEAIAIQARLDAEAAYIALTPANLPGGLDPGNDNLASLTLSPGIYTAQSGAFRIQGGDLTLDAQGNQNAVWVFQMATTLTVGGPGADFPQSVTLINGAQAKNIFWQVGSAATINAAGGGTMKGTIISQAGVSISTAGNVNIVTLDGRALSLGASVTVVNTVINVPAE
ncbi:ice-binding family protein [Pseudidiomarina marina]|uniref:Ig-like domain-containing protein n=1 Tax=Pseudidiomarina marina TaxID=502366 RepID=UPI00384A591B